MRDWLSARRLGEEVLRVNRVGADPGPSHLTRAFGLAHGGLGAVFPVLDEDSRAIYAQLRYLHPETAGPKYANPTREIARRPDLALVRTPKDSATTRVIVCEGLPDALSAAQAGSRAVAILGTGADAARAAAEIHGRFPSNRLVIAMDADEAGQRAAQRLVTALRGLDHHDMHLLEVPQQCGDLNGWLCGNTVQFLREVQAAARGPAVDPSAVRSRAVDLAPVSFELDG
ncbi:MAG: toprim domain-containing protein [Microthrixaceae bacterium]